MTRWLTALFALILLIAGAYLSRHVWLANATGYRIANTAFSAVGLTTPSAQRPELITLASHAKLKHPNGQYHIHGQLFNPLTIPLSKPDILLLQVDLDGQLIRQQRFTPLQWQVAVGESLPPQQLVEFTLAITEWPATSWGYRLHFIDRQ